MATSCILSPRHNFSSQLISPFISSSREIQSLKLCNLTKSNAQKLNVSFVRASLDDRSQSSRLHASGTAEAIGFEKPEKSFDEVKGELTETVASELELLSSEKFDWSAHWYPAAIVNDLEEDIPKPVTILGRNMVIWWDKNSKNWKCFADSCPHRLAPLSEGRIHESGGLQCSYHGWVFGGDGNCKFIPQAPEGSSATENLRSCARVYPCAEHQGMLWIWLQTGAEASAKASLHPIPTVPELGDPDFSFDLAFRDLPYGWDTLIENLMDPAHVNFAHHGILSNRNRAKPLSLSVTNIHTEGYEGHSETGGAKFTAPCLFTLEFNLPSTKPEEKIRSITTIKTLFTLGKKLDQTVLEKKKRMVISFYCVPVSPGRSKLFFAFPSNFIPKFTKLIPRWIFHIGQLTVLDSDLYFLHLQERALVVEGGTENYSRACFTPTPSDKFVIAFRQWLKRFGGSVPDYGPIGNLSLPPTPNKELLMERQKSHVLQCKSCKGAQTGFERLRFGLFSASALIQGTLIFFALTGKRLQPIPTLILLVTSAVFLLAAVKLNQFIYRSYFFQDYIHAKVK